ncbi:MAG: radical SAM protein [Candidatus Omnitrophica bacterium]|nr:radical SAM protein [Candidatus Omnitrophota bacterium]
MNSANSKKIKLIKNILPHLKKLTDPCRICHHKCNINRLKGKKGICRSSEKVAVYSYSPHYGEEPPLSGVRGSGTIFFTHCNLQCVYCQNYTFSQKSDFEEIETEELAERMLELERMGCHNINLVSPTHYAYQIIMALQIAIKRSLNIPIVYNTGGYDSMELIKLLDGIIDIYLPDMRYSRDEAARKFSHAADYAENNRQLIKEMFRQKGLLRVDKNGVAEKGVIVRLLILPNSVSGTVQTLKFLKKEVSKDIYLSVMSQYYPTYLAGNFPEIQRRINQKEYREVIDAIEKFGFTNGWIQGFRAESEHFLGTNIKPTY